MRSNVLFRSVTRRFFGDSISINGAKKKSMSTNGTENAQHVRCWNCTHALSCVVFHLSPFAPQSRFSSKGQRQWDNVKAHLKDPDLTEAQQGTLLALVNYVQSHVWGMSGKSVLIHLYASRLGLPA